MRNAVGGLLVENRDEAVQAVADIASVLEGNADIADVVFGLLFVNTHAFLAHDAYR